MSTRLRNALPRASAYRFEAVGLLALAALAVAVLLLLAYLNRAFTESVPVLARVPGTAAPLSVGAEVKLRGVPVGRVVDAQLVQGDNVLTLELDPEQARLVPEDVSARVLPATLFGLQFVDLAPPAQVENYGLEAGDVIEPDLSAESVQTTELLADVYPVLASLDPAQLNVTLTALAQALDGRGAQISDTVAALDQYLTDIGPEVPRLLDDVRKLAELAETLEAAAPDLLAFLRNAVVVGQSVADQRAEIRELVGAGSLAADTLDTVLTQNEDELETLLERLQPTLVTLVENRQGLAAGVRALPGALDRLAAVLSVEPALNVDGRVPSDNRCRYTPAERPNYPEDLYSPYSPVLDPETCRRRPAPAPDLSGDEPDEPPAAAPHTPLVTSSSGSPEEKRVLGTLLAPVLQVPVREVPDVVGLLFGPILRGGVLGGR